MRSFHSLRAFFAAIVLSLIAATGAHACPACSNLSLPMANPAADEEFNRGSFTLALDTTSTVFDFSHDVGIDDWEPGLLPEDQPVDHVLDFTLFQANVFATYGVTPRLRLGMRVPFQYVETRAAFNNQQGERLQQFESIHHRNESLSGIGDIAVEASYVLFQPTESRLGGRMTLSLGVSAPTGGIEEDPYLRGAMGLEHQHIQFGSGTWDPSFALNYGYVFEGWKLTSFLTANTPFYYNENGYRKGAQFNTGIGAVMDFGWRRWSVLTQLEYHHERTSRWEESPAELTGRREVLVNLGLGFSPLPTWRVTGNVLVPLWQTADQGRVTIPAIVGFGLQWTRFAM